MTNIYIISDKTYVGDRSNLFGIAETIKSRILNSEIREFSLEELSQAASTIGSEKEKAIVISAGIYGIKAIEELKKLHKDKILALHVFHQIIQEEKISHYDLIDVADLIALPSHSLNTKFIETIGKSNTKLVQTIGVAHNSRKEALIEAYEKDKKLLPNSDKYLAIILPGDAPDSNGQMKYYIPQMAEKLARNVASIAKEENYAILITNGPRTGKHDPKTGEILRNHQDNITDDVTRKFVEILESEKVQFKLFDFQRGQKNYKNLIFGAILHNKNSIILAPGESTSMISECTDLIQSGAVIIYMNEAMNENHYKYVMSEFKNNRAHIMEDNIIRRAAISHTKPLSAREIVTKAVMEEIIDG